MTTWHKLHTLFTAAAAHTLTNASPCSVTNKQALAAINCNPIVAISLLCHPTQRLVIQGGRMHARVWNGYHEHPHANARLAPQVCFSGSEHLCWHTQPLHDRCGASLRNQQTARRKRGQERSPAREQYERAAPASHHLELRTRCLAFAHTSLVGEQHNLVAWCRQCERSRGEGGRHEGLYHRCAGLVQSWALEGRTTPNPWRSWQSVLHSECSPSNLCEGRASQVVSPGPAPSPRGHGRPHMAVLYHQCQS